MKAQLQELLTSYGPVDMLWFDGQWEGTWTDERGRDLYCYVRALQPSIIINNRVAGGRRLRHDRSQGPLATTAPPSRKSRPPASRPRLGNLHDDEPELGIQPGGQELQVGEKLVRNLVDIASKGGNFLLNVGPTAEGEFPAGAWSACSSIGDVDAANGERSTARRPARFRRCRGGARR